jgi:hypothetical protein
MIEERFRVRFEILTSRLVGYSRCTKHTVSYIGDDKLYIELAITDNEGTDTRIPRIQITYIRHGHTRIDCSLWQYSGEFDYLGFNDVLDLLLEDDHPTLTRE